MNNTKVAVIGGGIAGLTVAYRLAQKGFKVKLFEALDRLGGLTRTTNIQGQPAEIFYHHFFPTDDYFLKICKEIGINDKIRWLKAKMGYLSSGTLFDFGTPLSLLRFKPLALRDKIRFALSILKIKTEKSLEEMDLYTAEDWLIKNSGKHIFNTIWRPLLIQKFGAVYKNIPMIWLWKKLQTRSLSKRNIFTGEKLAYLKGSSEIFINRLRDNIILLGGDIVLNQRVNAITITNTRRYALKTDNSAEEFDIAVSTVAPEILDKLMVFPSDFNNKLREFKQLGIVCLLLVINKPLTNYYWLNIGDEGFPFGLVVEHTNFYSSENYNGRHIVYISKYFDTSDAIHRFTNEEVSDYFLKYLVKINDNFKKDWIEEFYVFRESFAQPIIRTNYFKIKPDYHTTLPNFYWISANHVYPDDRGINYSIKMAEEVVDDFNV